VAGHEYARPNTGASITPESSGNGALPTHHSEERENKDNEANNRRILVLRHSHDAVIRVFDEAGNEIEAHEQPRELKQLEMRIAISTNR
jgi:hypothetical protein